MPFVAIIGAGDLGGASAQALASLDCTPEIRLIDERGEVAAGKALDIVQAAPIDGYRTRVTSSSELRAAAGADVMLLADPAGRPAGVQGEEGLAMIRRLWELAAADRTVIVCAAAEAASVMEQGIRELGVARRRLVGSAPLAFEAAVRSLVAATADGSALDVRVMALGAPPKGLVPCWSQSTIGGASLTGRLTSAQLAGLEARAPRLWPPAVYALGSAAARVAKGVLQGSRDEMTCFVGLDGELGVRGRVAALPVRLGPAGVERIVQPEMTGAERVKFDSAMS